VKGKTSGLTTTKAKTNSQLSAAQSQGYQLTSTNSSARALFTKNQAEIVLNRIGQAPKQKLNKESMAKSSTGSKRKAPVATIAISKPTQNSEPVVLI
jgi:hypothetical protein